MLNENQIEMKYEELKKQLRELRSSSRKYRRNPEYKKNEPVEYWRHMCILDIERLRSTVRLLEWVLDKERKTRREELAS